MPWTCLVSYAKLIVDPETEAANAVFLLFFAASSQKFSCLEVQIQRVKWNYIVSVQT